MALPRVSGEVRLVGSALLFLLAPTLPGCSTSPTIQEAEIRSLIAVTNGGDTKERITAMADLRKLGLGKKLFERKGDVITALGQALRDKDPEVSDAAADALEWMGPESVDVALQALAGGNAHAKSNAALILCSLAYLHKDELDRFDKAIPLLARYVRDPEKSVRGNSVSALSLLSKAAIPALAEALGMEDGWPSTATEGLVRHGKDALPALLGALQSKEEAVRVHAAHGLQLIGTTASDAVPALIAALNDESRRVRGSAVSALGAMGPKAKSAVPPILALLQDPKLVTETARALHDIGPGVDHLPLLIDALARTEDEREQGELSMAIAAVGKDVVPPLVSQLENPKLSVRRGVVFTLMILGPASAPAVPALINVLRQGDLRGLAAEALGAIGPGAKEAVSALIEDLKRDSWAHPRNGGSLLHHSSSAKALGEIGAVAVPELLTGLKSGDDLVGTGCIIALGRIGPSAKEALAPVRALLDSSKTAVLRAFAIRTLISIGADPKTLRPILKTLINDSHPVLSTTAKAVLETLDMKVK